LTRAFKARIAEANLPRDLEFPGLSATRPHDLRHTHVTLGTTDAAVPVPVTQTGMACADRDNCGVRRAIEGS